MKKAIASAALAAGVLPAMAGGVQTVDFDGLVHGEIITNQFAGQGLTVTFSNPNRSFDIGAAFDTTLTGTADPDLEDPWDGGNIASNEVLGRLMILATDDTGADSGVLTNPNDEGNRPAGTITLDWDSELLSFGLDIVDIEGVIQESSSLQFFLAGSEVGSFTFTELVTRDASISFGNNSANRVSAITAAELGSTFDRVIINVGGSSGFDNLNWTVPAPGAVALMGLGGLAASRRRR